MFSSHQESPSCPPENRPSGTRKNKPLSLFIAAILQHSLLYSTFSFRIQWPLRLSLPPSLFCLCSIQQSDLSLINQAFFLFSQSFSRLERRDWWLGTGMHRVDAAAKKEAGPDEFLWNSSDSASYFLCSFSLGHLDGSGWDENKESWINSIRNPIISDFPQGVQPKL